MDKDIQCSSCGHERKEIINDNGNWEPIGKRFIKILSSIQLYGDFDETLVPIKLYACPVCGAIKMVRE